MSIPFLEATIREDHNEAERLCGLALSDEWFAEHAFAAMRLEQLRDDPEYRPWGPHLLALREGAGAASSMRPPRPDYLNSYAPGGVEIGYTIGTESRGHGYATEACLHLMRWAAEDHAVTRFVLSISPSNAPSLRIADKLGFRRVGEHDDPEDGLEYEFVREGVPARD